MSVDVELDSWRQQWQSVAAIPLELRAKVERQSRWMRIALIGDVLVTLLIGGGAIAWAVRRPQPDIVLLALTTWLFLAAAWTFTLTVHRRHWSPSAEDTATFLVLSVRRCRGRLAAVWFGAGLFVSEIAFCLGWIHLHNSDKRQSLWNFLWFSSAAIDMVWGATLVFFVALLWYRRRKVAELENLLRMRRELSTSVS